MTTSTNPHSMEQLTLLSEPAVPVRFRLDDATRRRGLRHIAEIRAQLGHRTTQETIDRTERSAA